LLLAAAQQQTAAEDWKGLWTDPNDPTLPVEFEIGGEYVGEIEGGDRLGCQIIVLGKGAFQAVVLPGGLPGADYLRDDARIIKLLREMADNGKYTAAICAAPRVLAHAGLLDGKRATSFPGSLDSATVPGLDYLEQSVVTDGRVITSRGPGTAMDFALELIEKLSGKQKRDEVEAGLQRPA